MIIQCVNCFKKFEVESTLIPNQGRTIKCGLCNHTWFYKTDTSPPLETLNKTEVDKNIDVSIKNESNHESKARKKNNAKKINKSSYLGLGKLLSYLIVFIISFTSLILILETFKIPLGNIYPGLEFLLYSLFETIKDISLFFKNLFV